MRILKKVVTRKVRLADVAKPQPSVPARIVLDEAIKNAYLDQQALRKKAYLLKSN